ncbi:VasL domain-containing protein [Lelliottia sp. V89_10]|uniref:VasL domain-containing protein n=1 Tax=Lelliottia wanjuensis TaxID=3050585 RepID=UPI00249F748E|nr:MULTISPECIES: VasL domain-containing protein [unclassified Lelliottia]MDI3360037.1 VasL domain-containing protein [Lelliottia sp. V89_13]MDK9548263.1 VasL domain-containing protein [Lelliottia sp. V89_5]MDK9594897.1 VasL domain-containing protein [Lelliottia sp. V89_10]
MHDVHPRPVKTGHDPRALPDFIALREEMAKLTHPARPDVNWKQVEALSLSLFEINGVELQTGAWYTLARSHLARVNGINEGLAILNALLSHQWTQLWPQPVHARAEILNGLFQRLQKIFRTYSLNPADLTALEQAEKLIEAMDDILARQALKHACQTAPLMQQVRAALTRLENSSSQESLSAAITLPAQALASLPANADSAPVSRLVYVIRPEPEVNVEVIHETLPPPRRWPVFLAGACSSLVVGAMALWGWNFAHRADELSMALQASVAPLPQALTPDQIQGLRQPERVNGDPARWLKRASEQLDALAALPPGWTVQYGNALLNQGKTLWPENPEMGQMQKNWQQRLAANALPTNSLTGWYEGMQRLQMLADRLNALDGQKGKYITVSELKSNVYEMMNSFRQTVPVEEQLRQAASSPTQGADSIAQRQRIEEHLKRSIVSYSQLEGGDAQPK